MTVTPKALYTGGQLTSSAASLFASAALTTSVITSATFTNVDSAAHTLTVYIVRSGGSATAADTLIPTITMGPGTTYLAPELVGVTLGPGDAIFAKADAGTVITCAGINGWTYYQGAG